MLFFPLKKPGDSPRVFFASQLLRGIGGGQEAHGAALLGEGLLGVRAADGHNLEGPKDRRGTTKGTGGAGKG